MREIMAFSYREMLFLLGSKVIYAPKSTRNDKFKTINRILKNVVCIRSCRKPVLSEADFSCFFFWKRLRGRNWKHSIPDFEQNCSRFLKKE
jgi:hypothetical protein